MALLDRLHHLGGRSPQNLAVQPVLLGLLHPPRTPAGSELLGCRLLLLALLRCLWLLARPLELRQELPDQLPVQDAAAQTGPVREGPMRAGVSAADHRGVAPSALLDTIKVVHAVQVRAPVRQRDGLLILALVCIPPPLKDIRDRGVIVSVCALRPMVTLCRVPRHLGVGEAVHVHHWQWDRGNLCEAAGEAAAGGRNGCQAVRKRDAHLVGRHAAVAHARDVETVLVDAVLVQQSVQEPRQEARGLARPDAAGRDVVGARRPGALWPILALAALVAELRVVRHWCANRPLGPRRLRGAHHVPRVPGAGGSVLGLVVAVTVWVHHNEAMLVGHI
mmetsp:Transcript_39973/g.103478  ORF Transcript_39973/g.103478 Transcript_39973/m.103478 type:complete len:334 (+) Transcript_39973:781-1782(+)